jgi:hypothetical protein
VTGGYVGYVDCVLAVHGSVHGHHYHRRISLYIPRRSACDNK